jgi:hypothetical protein
VVVVVITIVVDMLHDSQSNLGEVKLADHGVADCIHVSSMWCELEIFTLPSLNVILLLLIFALE